MSDTERDSLSGATAAPQSPDSMTGTQSVRRQRLIDTVIQLISAGDGRAPEDLQMKEIADQSSVALGTVYRYFSSKDHLLAAALLQWAASLRNRTSTQSLRDTTAAERLSAVLHQAVDAYERQPMFARVLVLVANSADPYASECYAQMGAVVYPALGQALSEIDPDTRNRIIDVVGAVWYHCMVEWVNNRMTLKQLTEMLDGTCELLLG
jgi:AcrR family transcriptional regulator